MRCAADWGLFVRNFLTSPTRTPRESLITWASGLAEIYSEAVAEATDDRGGTASTIQVEDVRH